MIKLIAKNVTLGANGTVQTSQDGTPQIASLGSPSIGSPSLLVIGFKASAATTITINVSYDDGVTWLQAVAPIVLSAAGAQAVQIPPAPYVQLATSAAITITAWAYTA